MSVQIEWQATLRGSHLRHRAHAARMISAAISIGIGVAHKIAEEVLYALREDFRHGQISRDPKDWED